MSKTIKIWFELPTNILELDELSFLDALAGRGRDSLLRAIQTKVTDDLISKLKIPKIKITPEEIKDRMLTILAERALENKNE